MPDQTDTQVSPERSDLRFDPEPSFLGMRPVLPWVRSRPELSSVTGPWRRIPIVIGIDTHDGGFQAHLRRAGVQNEGNSSLQFVEHMFRPGWTDSSKAVGTRSCQRLSESPENLQENRMTWHSDCHVIKSGSNQIRHHGRFWEQNRQRPWPKPVARAFPPMGSTRSNERVSLVEPLFVPEMNDQRIKRGPFLSPQKSLPMLPASRASPGKAIYSFRRNSDKVLRFEYFYRCGNGFGEIRPGINNRRLHR